jgi:Spy/CpxP family protein refolding chaperone
MTRTKRRARLETLALLLGLPAFRGGPPPGAPGSIPNFYEALDLTDEQRARIREILEASRPESDSILRVALPRLRELTRFTREAISEILTDEQRTELEERFGRDRSRAPSRRRGDERSGPGRGGPPTDRGGPARDGPGPQERPR